MISIGPIPVAVVAVAAKTMSMQTAKPVVSPESSVVSSEPEKASQESGALSPPLGHRYHSVEEGEGGEEEKDLERRVLEGGLKEGNKS